MFETQVYSWSFFMMTLGIILGAVILIVEPPRTWVEALIYYTSVLIFVLIMAAVVGIFTYTLFGGKW